MSSVNQSEEHLEATDRLNDPDPFALARILKKRVRCCSQAGCAPADDAVYLWIDWTTCAPNDGAAPLTRQDWLNIIDEAASVGVSWVVFSMEGPASRMPHIFEIARWAQEAHGMTTAFHSRTGEVPQADLDAIQSLDPARSMLFLSQAHLARLSHLKPSEIAVHIADPENGERHHTCMMPGSMIFVNPQGMLYTCGMVKDNMDFRFGHVYAKKLNHVLHDPSLPHAVPEQNAHNASGCHGCPPLVAKYAVKNGQ